MVDVKVLSKERAPIALGELVNLGPGGAQVDLGVPLEVGDSVRIAFHSPAGGFPLSLDGQVRWRGTAPRGFSHGLVFQGLSPEDEHALGELLQAPRLTSVRPRSPARVRRVLAALRGRGGAPSSWAERCATRSSACAVTDFDVEVYGLRAGSLDERAPRLGRVDAVGQAFTVFKLSGPRRDATERSTSRSRAATRRRGRGTAGSPSSVIRSLSIEEASRRRDFTINAMLFDPRTGAVLDPHGGRRDLEARVLRAVDPASFGDDPLRALRAVQLAARFELTVEPETAPPRAPRCRSSELPAERVFGEIEKLLLKARRPSLGLRPAARVGNAPDGGAGARPARRHAPGPAVASRGRRLDPHASGRRPGRGLIAEASTGRGRSR